MTGRRWDDGVPGTLRDRLLEALGGRSPDDARACLEAGEALLASVLDADSASRDTALDLLVADALVTRAFECAADDREMASIADTAIERIGRHGATGQGGEG